MHEKTLKIKAKGTEYNIHNCAIRWRMSNSAKDSGIFAIALTVSEILTFQICYFENLGQCRGVPHLQLSHSIANINLNKSHTRAFSLALTLFEIFIFQNSWPWKCRSTSWRTPFIHSGTISMANRPTIRLLIWWQLYCLLCFSQFTRYSQIKNSKTLPWKWRSRTCSIRLETFKSI